MPLRLAVLATVLVCLLSTPAGAGAGAGKNVDQDPNGDVTVGVWGADGSAGSSGSSGGTVSCHYYETSGTDTDALDYLDPGQMQEGGYYWVTCIDTATGDVVASRYFIYQPGAPAVSGLALARSAVASLTLGFPSPRTNPAIDQRQLPGIDTWMWVDAADWQPVTATASIPGLSASVTATPTSVRWDMGDGAPPVVCDGPGTPYDPDRPPADQSSACTHRYQDRGAYPASATVHWELTWSSTDGDGGTLTPVERTTTFTMRVAERQAVGR